MDVGARLIVKGGSCKVLAFATLLPPCDSFGSDRLLQKSLPNGDVEIEVE